MKELPPHDYEEYEIAAAMGEWPADGLDFRPQTPEQPASVAEQLIGHIPAMDKSQILQMRDGLLAATDFHERYAKSIIEHDVIGLLRHLPDGTVETLSNKLAREQAKGKHESAAFGLGKLGDQQIVMYVMDWDFFAGSFGAVSGEKFQMATDLAISKGLPMLSIYSSSGVRQHENYAGLIQMQRGIHALEKFKARSDKPHIALLLGQVWGGISASIAPLADSVVAVQGTEYGFSGPNVIAAYEGKTVEPGAQRAEQHLVNRNVDVVVSDADSALRYIEQLVKLPDGSKKQAMPVDLTASIEPGADITDRSELLSERGILPISVAKRALREVVSVVEGVEEPEPVRVAPTPEELYARYDRLARSGQHPDAEFFTQQVFSDVVPLYNRYVIDEKLLYPAVIASVGKIGLQPFLVIGGQASYQQSYDGLRRIPSSPAPADYEYLERMLALGERWKLPAVYFADTLGAKPTLAGEEQNQMYRIAKAIARGIEYRYPVMTVVTGALGSGGGLTVGPNVDYFAMLDNSLAFVAEARSAASILYKTPHPTKQQITDTLASMRATAWDQKDLKLIDEVIPEDANAYQTAANVLGALARAYSELQDLSPRQLRNRRDKRLRNPGGLRVKRSH